MANAVYNRGKYKIATGANLASADLRLLLVKSSYVFDATHNFVSDVVAGSAEISVSGYSRQTLASLSVTEDDTNGMAYLDADDVVFTALASGQTIGGAVLYIYNASDASAAIIGFFDLIDTATNGENVTVRWDSPANGAVLKLS